MSIGFFTDPYPDELLYSACARFIYRVGYLNRGKALLDLFGNSKMSVMVDLPNRLNHLIKILPPGHRYTSDSLLDKHTLLPYYLPFLPVDRMRIIRSEMKGVSSNHAFARLGMTTDRLAKPLFLRFCLYCVEEDRANWGETYWHRIHQIAGVEVCPTHEVFLENSIAPWRASGRHLKQFYIAERSVSLSKPRTVNVFDFYQSILYRIAQQAQYLLERKVTLVGSSDLRERYYHLLLEKGFAYYNGRSRTTKLLNAFKDFYSTEFLEKINCPIGSTAITWVSRLVIKDKGAAIQNPLHHILLILFLDSSIDYVFNCFKPFQPFGIGPWPCLNKAANHWGEATVHTYRVIDNTGKSRRELPLGTFTCSKCDFVYKRIGPDKIKEDRFKFDSVLIYGSMWENLLRELWDVTEMSIGGVAKNLGVSELTVIRHAIRLGLTKTNKREIKGYKRYFKYNPTFHEILNSHREKISYVINSNPRATRSQLMAMSNTSYLWLRRHDSRWLEAQLPSPTPKPKAGLFIDWEKADKRLSEEIIEATLYIKNQPGRPLRVSLSELAKIVGNKSWLEKYLHRLPQTQEALLNNLESSFDFSVRKILWAEEQYITEGIRPTRSQFVRRAVLLNKAGRSHEIHSIVDAALMRLQVLG